MLAGREGGVPRARTGQNAGSLATGKLFRTLGEKTIPLTRWLRVLGETDLESRRMDHDVSLMAGEELTPGRLVTGIMRPRRQTGILENGE